MALYIQTYPRRRWRRRVHMAQMDACDIWLPLNVREDEDAFELTALVPGLKADDLTIQVIEDVLRIEGEYRSDEGEYLLQELPTGTFRRTLRLPAPVDAEKVEATIKDGVLTLRLPKAESARPKRIKIASK